MEIQNENNETVNDEAGRVMSISEEIKIASEEQKLAINEISNSTLFINDLASANAAGAEEMSGGSQEIVKIADMLSSIVDFFKVK